MMDDFVACCSWREWESGEAKELFQGRPQRNQSILSQSRSWRILESTLWQKSCRKETYLILLSKLVCQNLFLS